MTPAQQTDELPPVPKCDDQWKADYKLGWNAFCNGGKLWHNDTDGYYRGFKDAEAKYSQ